MRTRPRRTPLVCFSALALMLVAGGAAEEEKTAPLPAPEAADAPEPQASPTFGEMTKLAGYTTDKGAHGHHFTEIYEHIFFPLRNEPIRIFEIGIAEGGSIELWEKYFPKARIYAIDIEDRSILNSERVTTGVVDQSRRDQLRRFIEIHGGDFDFILDDGGHQMHQQQTSFGVLFPSVKPGGYYVIEDLHTSLPFRWPGNGVNEDESNSTLTMIQDYLRTRKFDSHFMTPAEEQYLTEHVEYCLLFFRNTEAHSMTAIFRKKAD